MNKFNKNKSYLLFYCIKSILILSILIFVTILVKGFSLEFNPNLLDFFLPLFALLFCALPSSVLHNCAHRNIKPVLINDLVGEILGTFMLYGYRGFALGHMFHHKYPDNPKYDPHPPRGYSFLYFVLSPIEATLRIIETSYYEIYGDNVKNRTNIKYQKVFFNISMLLRVILILMLLDLKLFILLYLPIYFANIFVFAHINYACHIENEDNDSEIIDLNSNLYYQFVNKVSFGGYFHKSHHIKPQFFNPSKSKSSDTKKVISYVVREKSKPRERAPLYKFELKSGLRDI